MAKILSTYVKNYQFFPKSAIYDDDAEFRISEFNRHTATLYFLVRTKKATFVPRSFSTDENFSFHGLIDVAGKRFPIRFSTVEMMYQAPQVKAHFANMEEFAEYSMRQWGDPSNLKLTSRQKYAAKAQVDLAKSTPAKLVVECPVRYSMTREHVGETVLSPYQLINLYNPDYPAPLEILYIGKSNDDTWKRIYNHNKWGLIEEHRDESQDLLVYFLEIDKVSIVDNHVDSLRTIVRTNTDVSVEEATVASEAALINYFIKEKKFNDQHVGSDIAKSKAIIDGVKSRGYTDLVVECKLDGTFGVLGTPSTPHSRNHHVEFVL
jgi:hypothetical protein